MNGFVLDASVALTWVFEDEQFEAADLLIKTLPQRPILVPSLWYFETANGLLNAVRRNRFTFAEAEEVGQLLTKLPVGVDLPAHGATFHRTFQLAHKNQLSVYDAAYLEVAERRELPLATLDRRLARACEAIGVQQLLFEDL